MINPNDPAAPKKNAQGSALHDGITQFQFVSTHILSGLIAAGLQDEDLIAAKERDPSLKDLTSDEYFAVRACQLATALFKEWNK